jgi:hypothetical protein
MLQGQLRWLQGPLVQELHAAVEEALREQTVTLLASINDTLSEKLGFQSVESMTDISEVLGRAPSPTAPRRRRDDRLAGMEEQSGGATSRSSKRAIVNPDITDLDVEAGDQMDGSLVLKTRGMQQGSSSHSSDLDPKNLLQFRLSETCYGKTRRMAESVSECRSESTRWLRQKGDAQSSYFSRKMGTVVHNIEELQRYADELERPNGHNAYTQYFFQHLSKPFDIVSMVVIMINVAFVVYTTNMEIQNPELAQEEYISIVNHSFTGYYIFEIVVRMVTQRSYFFFGPMKSWHFFDAVLIFTSLITETGISFLRSLRVLRAAKIIRFYKLLNILGLSDLEVMANCLTGSFSMLFWCMIMILFFTFLFSVFFVQAVALHISDEGESNGSLAWFSSVQEGMLTLLMITTGGADWKEVYDAIKPAGVIPSAAIVLYILLFSVAVWNVVTSTFVDKALKLAKPSDQAIINEARKQATDDAKELRNTFRKMDLDTNGRLDLEEFDKCMAMPEFDKFLQVRGLDIKETKVFFRMLAQNKSSVDIDQIVNSCMRVRGFATSIDLHTMRYELRRMQQSLMKNMKMLQHFHQDRFSAATDTVSPH